MRKSALNAALMATPKIAGPPAVDSTMAPSRHAYLLRLGMLWQQWKVVAHRIGDVQARVLLGIFYFAVLGPFALGVKLFSDPLRLRLPQRSGWTERPVSADDAATQATRQF